MKKALLAAALTLTFTPVFAEKKNAHLRCRPI